MEQVSQLHDFELARTNGSQAVLTLVVNSQPGPQVMVTSEDLTRLVSRLLGIGRSMRAAGGIPADLQDKRPAIQCDQFGLALGTDGETALNMAFGTVIACAALTPKSIPGLVQILQRMQAGQVHPGPRTAQ